MLCQVSQLAQFITSRMRVLVLWAIHRTASLAKQWQRRLRTSGLKLGSGLRLALFSSYHTTCMIPWCAECVRSWGKRFGVMNYESACFWLLQQLCKSNYAVASLKCMRREPASAISSGLPCVHMHAHHGGRTAASPLLRSRLMTSL